MNLSFRARPLTYFGFGPFIGLICMMIYSTIYENVKELGSFTDLHELLIGVIDSPS